MTSIYVPTTQSLNLSNYVTKESLASQLNTKLDATSLGNSGSLLSSTESFTLTPTASGDGQVFSINNTLGQLIFGINSATPSITFGAPISSLAVSSLTIGSTIPGSSGTATLNGFDLVDVSSSQTLSNKTLSSPTIASILNGSGVTLTLPSLSGNILTDTSTISVSNKTMTIANGNVLSASYIMAGTSEYPISNATPIVGQVLTFEGSNVIWNTPSNGVQSISFQSPLTGGVVTSSGTVGLGTTTVSAGSYTYGNFTVDAYGRLTSASSNVNGNFGTLTTTGVVTLGGRLTLSSSGLYGSATTGFFMDQFLNIGCQPSTASSGTWNWNGNSNGTNSSNFSIQNNGTCKTYKNTLDDSNGNMHLLTGGYLSFETSTANGLIAEASSAAQFSSSASVGDVILRAGASNNLRLQTGTGADALHINSSNACVLGVNGIYSANAIGGYFDQYMNWYFQPSSTSTNAFQIRGNSSGSNAANFQVSNIGLVQTRKNQLDDGVNGNMNVVGVLTAATINTTGISTLGNNVSSTTISGNPCLINTTTTTNTTIGNSSGNLVLNGASLSGGVASFTTLTATTKAILHGTSTNDNAAGGYIGEYISNVVQSASPINASYTLTAYDITSISLSAGDWDCYASMGSASNGVYYATNVAYAWISTTSSSYNGNVNAALIQVNKSAGDSSLLPFMLHVGQMRVSIASTTTVYLSCMFNYGGNTPSAYGFIGARRVR